MRCAVAVRGKALRLELPDVESHPGREPQQHAITLRGRRIVLGGEDIQAQRLAGRGLGELRAAVAMRLNLRELLCVRLRVSSIVRS